MIDSRSTVQYIIHSTYYEATIATQQRQREGRRDGGRRERPYSSHRMRLKTLDETRVLSIVAPC